MNVDTIGSPEHLDVAVAPPLHDHYRLSPQVVIAGEGYEMLVRLVNRDDDADKKVSRIYHARSLDGRSFDVDPQPIIDTGHAGADDDRGCEDPTITRTATSWAVFYSGFGGPAPRSTMLRADCTNDWSSATKHGLAFDDPRFSNPKEAAVVAVPAGYRMFFEYATDGASRIGVADAATLDGPWVFGSSLIEPRSDKFDPWHLSPSSAVRLDDGTHVLFYNGATKETVWRIGWAHLSNDARTVLKRCEEPIISTFDLQPGDTDIAFAASSVVDQPGQVTIYYSISDRRLLRQRLRVDGAASDSAFSGELT